MNMQNFPKNKMIKNLLRAAPGRRLLQLDYSQAELRVLGVIADDEFLIDSYARDLDLHNNVARRIFGDDFTEVHRSMAKTVNFGIAYGRGPSAIAEEFGLSMQESKQIIADWFSAMPQVQKFIKDKRREAKTGARQQTLTGRVRHYVLTDTNLYHVQNEYVNTPIQSLASDCTLFSILEINKWLIGSKEDARIVSTVHDSIVLEVADDMDTVRRVADACVRIMAEVPKTIFGEDCKIPFKADAESGYTYGGLSAIEKE